MVLLLPPGRDILTGFSYIVPDCDGRTPDDGRTAPPPSLLAMQEKQNPKMLSF
jgi:hypothetical protein